MSSKSEKRRQESVKAKQNWKSVYNDKRLPPLLTLSDVDLQNILLGANAWRINAKKLLNREYNQRKQGKQKDMWLTHFARNQFKTAVSFKMLVEGIAFQKEQEAAIHSPATKRVTALE